MMTDKEDILARRGRGLYRLKRMRQLDAPLLVIRTEQMILWGIRQQLKADWNGDPYRQLPGWEANYQKFVLIHTVDTDSPS